MQLHRALDLSGSFPDLRGPGRFAYLEWLYHLWKNEGDDAIPFALVGAVWLPPANRPSPTLPADWVESTWGHLAVPWLNDDVTEPDPHQPLLSRAALLVWSRRTTLQRRFPDPVGADRQSLASWLVTHRDGLSSHVELAAPLGNETAVSHRRRTVRTRLASLGRRSATPAEHLLATSLMPADLPSRSSWRRSPRPLGLNVVGHFSAASGLGEATRCTLRTTLASDVPHDVLDVGPKAASEPDVRAVGGPGHPCPFAISIIHDNVSHAMTTFRQLGRRFVLDRYAVGYWYWEAAEPPENTAEISTHLDEIWAASEFVADSLRAASAVPVYVMPPSVDLEVAAPLDRASLGIQGDAVCFLTMASVSSVLERKNPLGALEAFRRAFAGGGDGRAVLIMKLTGLDHAPAVRDELDARIGDLPVVVVDRQCRGPRCERSSPQVMSSSRCTGLRASAYRWRRRWRPDGRRSPRPGRETPTSRPPTRRSRCRTKSSSSSATSGRMCRACTGPSRISMPPPTRCVPRAMTRSTDGT